jgi:hypothetical protein
MKSILSEEIIKYIKEHGGAADRRAICHKLCDIMPPLAVFKRIESTRKSSLKTTGWNRNTSYGAAARWLVTQRIYNLQRDGYIRIEDGMVYLTYLK